MPSRTVFLICLSAAIILAFAPAAIAAHPDAPTHAATQPPPGASPRILMSDARFIATGQPVRATLPRSAASLSHVELADPGGHVWSLTDAVDFLGYKHGVSPQVLLALAEHFSGLLTRGAPDAQVSRNLMGIRSAQGSSLWDQLEAAAIALSSAFYTYYNGQPQPTAKLPDGTTVSLQADNAATYALLAYFAQVVDTAQAWRQAIGAAATDQQGTSAEGGGFATTFSASFGDPQAGYLSAPRPTAADLAAMPTLKLPWAYGDRWNFNCGPHDAYLQGLDFQPVGHHGCSPNIVPDRYVAAAAPGKMTADIIPYFLVIDHDGDGNVNTGWQTVYGHTANRLKQPGQMVGQGERLGNPSCLGGTATGVHLHFAVKYRNVYQPAAGLALSGWTVHNGLAAYHGTLTRPGDSTSPRESGYRPGGAWDFSRSLMTSDNQEGDTTPPTSCVLPIQGPIPADSSVQITWEGSDPTPGTGVQSYDVQYRIGPTGDWTNWLINTPSTSASFGPTQPVTLQPGYTYYLRSRATDGAGNIEAYPAGDGDAQFTVLVPSGATERIVNGGFESNEGWQIPQTTYPAAYGTAITHTGQRAMLTGITDATRNTYSYSSAQQTIHIPADATSATLRAWLYPVSDDPATTALAQPMRVGGGPEALSSAIASTQDTQYVLVLDANGVWIDTLLWQCTNSRQWALHVFDLSKYAGQVITLRFGTYNSGTGGVTALYVDDVSVELGQAAPPTPPPDQTIACLLPLIYQRPASPSSAPTPTPVAYPEP
ncbi:MAG: peptidoglycan DD-metalloendopeptidase family protein [Chloroflexi bacterium]|jgi:hypothetical protein|nr:peptidoglycan DD-metalloendopeptidase family protein [Chloroflexota bacterium]